MPLVAQVGAEPQTLLMAPKLNIVVLEGDGAINNIRRRTAREPVIQAVDENRKPVLDASSC
jgi:hypothetical protein